MWFASHLGSGREGLEDGFVAKLFEAVTKMAGQIRIADDGGKPGTSASMGEAKKHPLEHPAV